MTAPRFPVKTFLFHRKLAGPGPVISQSTALYPFAHRHHQKVCVVFFFLILLYKDQTTLWIFMYISTLCISLGPGESRNDDHFLSVFFATVWIDPACVCAFTLSSIFCGLADVSGKRTFFRQAQNLSRASEGVKIPSHLLVSVHVCEPPSRICHEDGPILRYATLRSR